MKILDNIKKLKHSKSLIGRSIRGGGVLTAGSLSENLLRFVRNMILARLLAPDAFGVMATIIATVAAAEAFAEVGLSQSIIQNKKGADKEFLNIIWWVAALRAIILYMIAYLAAPYICNFLKIPETVHVMRTAFSVILFKGLTSPNIFLLQKDMKFTKWVLLTQSAGIIGILVAIISAYFFRNVWALVFGYISESFIILLFSYVFYPLMPTLKFNKAYALDIISFSKKVFGLPILMILYVQADNFVIGKVLSIGTLGLYYLARDLADMPNKIFSKISPVFLPTFSLMQDDKEALKKTLFLLTETTGAFGLPFFTFFILFSQSLLSLIYSPAYGAIAIPFSIFCAFVFLYICSSLIMNAVVAIGHPDKHRVASIIRTVVFLGILYPATKYFGLIGASFSAFISVSLCLAIQVHYLKDLLEIHPCQYIRCFKKGAYYSLIVLIPGIFLNTFFSLQDLGSIFSGVSLCVIAWCFGIAMLSRYKKESLQSF